MASNGIIECEFKVTEEDMAMLGEFAEQQDAAARKFFGEGDHFGVISENKIQFVDSEGKLHATGEVELIARATVCGENDEYGDTSAIHVWRWGHTFDEKVFPLMA